jgi:hypothetical protein
MRPGPAAGQNCSKITKKLFNHLATMILRIYTERIKFTFNIRAHKKLAGAAFVVLKKY